MITFLIKRLVWMLPLLLGITFLSFLLMKATPGDPTQVFTDPTIGAKDLIQLKKNLGLDQPVFIQYLKWLQNLMQGNFGYSFVTGQPVWSMILDRLPATLLLSISSLVLTFIITLPMGLISAYKADGFWDHLITITSFIGMALPTFWLGLMLMLLFSITLNWMPSSGFLSPHLLNASFFEKSVDILHHMVLPLITLLIGSLAGLTRYYRFGVLQVLSQDYIKAARARGISESKILYKHALKNAILPILTLLGLQLPELIGGAFVIEYLFAWPGMGKLGVDAVFARDYPVLMGTLVMSSVLILWGSLLSDLAYQWADPRIRNHDG